MSGIDQTDTFVEQASQLIKAYHAHLETLNQAQQTLASSTMTNRDVKKLSKQIQNEIEHLDALGEALLTLVSPDNHHAFTQALQALADQESPDNKHRIESHWQTLVQLTIQCRKEYRVIETIIRALQQHTSSRLTIRQSQRQQSTQQPARKQAKK